jgi:hypothetical protein
LITRQSQFDKLGQHATVDSSHLTEAASPVVIIGDATSKGSQLRSAIHSQVIAHSRASLCPSVCAGDAGSTLVAVAG